jgi:hypothetical protein
MDLKRLKSTGNRHTIAFSLPITLFFAKADIREIFIFKSLFLEDNRPQIDKKLLGRYLLFLHNHHHIWMVTHFEFLRGRELNINDFPFPSLVCNSKTKNHVNS